jgi:Domain of unknown function (DUF4157)/Lysine-specific metallo-endopeptidase
MGLCQQHSVFRTDVASDAGPRRRVVAKTAGSRGLPLFLGRAREEAPSRMALRKANCGCGSCPECTGQVLGVSEPSDAVEREADVMADRVLRSADTGHPTSAGIGTASEQPSGMVPAGGGPLDAVTRAWMEPRFGADFGRVRIHTGTSAATRAANVSAQAYTVGEHVVFGAGQYQPGNEPGRRLLAHELAHVVQQRSGKAGGTLLRKSSFKSCTGNQPAQLDATVAAAQTALSRAARVVAGAYGRPAHVTAANRQLLLDHFHTTSKGDMKDILGTYVSIETAFRKSLSFKCESKCPTTPTSQTCGYAYNHQWFGGSGPIHICFDTSGCDFATTPAPNQTALVIHEAAHRHAGIDDKAYRWEPAYPRLSAKQAKDNADSYAWFATLV